MQDLTVKINNWTVGGIAYGVDCRLESFPIITLPHVSFSKEVVPERFVPIYKLKKTEINRGSMVLVINTVPTDLIEMDGKLTRMHTTYIEPLTHKATVTVEFSEEPGVIYTCEIDSVVVETIGETSNAYRYVIDLGITEITGREV